MSIGERIAKIRIKNAYSQTELAKILNISRQAVSKWENDLSSPDTLNLIRLADVLNTNVEYLATGRGSDAPSPALCTKEAEVLEKIVIQEKIIERPVIQEKVIERVIDKPVVRRVVRTKFLRNPLEFAACGIASFILGFLLGWLIL